VYVASVALHDFRNYHSASLELAPTATLIIGANGQGKSNLLEAIGLLSIGKSVRGAPDAEVVRWGTQGSRIACELVGTAASRLEMQIEPGQRKQVRADGAALSSLSDLIGIMRTVHLAPDVIDYQFRSPSGRRRMLDILISQIDQGYLAALKRHRRIVQGINALCKHEQPDASVMDVWEAQLAWVAVEIMSRRNEVLKALQQAAQRYFEGLFRSESIEIKMRTTLPADGEDENELRDACLEALRAARGQSRRMGFVTKGAHRDRFDVLIGGRLIEAHASQGQTKGAYFAWKLAEGDVIEQTTGEKPLWLVDDPFSEMDRRRALGLLDLFRDRGQVILTTARDSDLGLDTLGFARWQVHDGSVTSLE